MQETVLHFNGKLKSELEKLLPDSMENLSGSVSSSIGGSLSRAEAGEALPPFQQKLSSAPGGTLAPVQTKQAEVFPVWATVGIVASLMTYGILQERIMTTPFGPNGRLFTASVFLVLVNRVATLVLAVAVTLWKGQSLAPTAPLQSYAGISLSNTLATTCQYDALKYVSFPVATLAKCAKMIPVMVWGTLMNRKNYSQAEYATAIVITLGCTAFILTGEIRSRVLEHSLQGVEYLFGGLLMATYLTFDGFTSTMQERLFREYRDITICNQITYCSMWSCLIALSACLSDGSLWTAVIFIRDYPRCMWDIAALSISAGSAQLFISFTIKKHGALAFATIMTTRQFLSILVSCAVFLNPLTIGQWLSTLVIFGALYTKFNSGKGGRRGGAGSGSLPAVSPGPGTPLSRKVLPNSNADTQAEGGAWGGGGAGTGSGKSDIVQVSPLRSFGLREVKVLTQDAGPGGSHHRGSAGLHDAALGEARC